jgi:hypothetical protein
MQTTGRLLPLSPLPWPRERALKNHSSEINNLQSASHGPGKNEQKDVRKPELTVNQDHRLERRYTYYDYRLPECSSWCHHALNLRIELPPTGIGGTVDHVNRGFISSMSDPVPPNRE